MSIRGTNEGRGAERRALQVYLRVLSLFYLYGAAVHVANLSGWGSLPPQEAPLHWVIADGVYLLLNSTMIAGIWLRKRWGVAAFLAAAGSQIVLYACFPDAFSMNGQQASALRGLIVFHAATLALYAVLKLAAGAKRTGT